MSRTFMEQQNCIMVAVAFDRNTEVLLETGGRLARRTGKSLHLVHVVEPWLDMLQSKALGGGMPNLRSMAQAMERRSVDQARDHLEEAAKALDPRVDVSTRVIPGKAALTLAAEALSSGACLVLVGAGSSTHQFVPKGLSTALSMMSTSPVPVMVMDGAAEASFTEERLTVLLADDLSAQSEVAVEFAFDLCTSLHNTDLIHLHVNPLTIEALEKGMEAVSTANDKTLNPTLAAQDVHGAVVEQLKHRLATRALGREEYLEAAGGNYETDIQEGNVEEALSCAATTSECNLIVLGRPHGARRKPFSIGALPLKMMLAGRRPIIIAPQE